MKILKSFSVLIIILTMIFSTACHKEGSGGKSSVYGYTKHHTAVIPNCVVYIKYGAKEFPGADVSKYDASITADANGYYEFKDLRKGDYYLYGVGYDASISEAVSGGVSIQLKYNKSTETNVPVTE
jgi:hypothetical protein